MNLNKIAYTRSKGLKPKHAILVSMMSELKNYSNVVNVNIDDDFNCLVGLHVELLHIGDNRKQTAMVINQIFMAGADCITSLNLKTKQRLWVSDKDQLMFKNISKW